MHVMRQMKQTAANMNPHTRPIIAEVDLAVEAIRIWNMVGTMLAVKERMRRKSYPAQKMRDS